MRRLHVPVVVLFTVLACGSVTPLAAQAPAGASAFVGTWDILMKPPTAAGPSARPIVLVAIDIQPVAGGGLRGTVRSGVTAGIEAKTLSEADGVLTLELRMPNNPDLLRLKGRRVGAGIEFEVIAPALPPGLTIAGVVAGTVATGSPTLPPVAPAFTPPPPDRQAFNAAVSKPRDLRAEALQKFLADYPDSTLKESATLALAQSLPTMAERVAALQQYIRDFPASADEGALQIAVTGDTREARIEGLKTFLAEHPDSPLKARAQTAMQRLATSPGTSLTPVRVGGNIRPPVKLIDVKPVYPPEAQRARVQGVVVIEATIDVTGRVTNARILRSIPELDQAALDAVAQWKFTATEVDGVPVPVIMTVTVNFMLA